MTARDGTHPHQHKPLPSNAQMANRPRWGVAYMTHTRTSHPILHPTRSQHENTTLGEIPCCGDAPCHTADDIQGFHGIRKHGMNGKPQGLGGSLPSTPLLLGPKINPWKWLKSKASRQTLLACIVAQISVIGHPTHARGRGSTPSCPRGVCIYVCMYVCIYVVIYTHTHTSENFQTRCLRLHILALWSEKSWKENQ